MRSELPYEARLCWTCSTWSRPLGIVKLNCSGSVTCGGQVLKNSRISRKGRLSWSKTVPFFSPSIPGLVRQNSRTLECRFYPLPPWPLLFLAVDATIAGPPWPARTTEPLASPATRASPSGGTAGPGHSQSFRTRIAVNLCYSTAQTAQCLTSRHRSTAPPPSHR